MSEQSLQMFSGSMVRVIEVKPQSHYEQIKLPGGQLVRDTHPTELYALLEKLNMPGFSHTIPRNAALDLYERHIEAIAKEAAAKAVDSFLAGSQP